MDTIQVPDSGSGALLVAPGDGPTLITNSSVDTTILIGNSSSIVIGQPDSVPLSPQSWVVFSGDSDDEPVYGLSSGGVVTVYKLPGAVGFFQSAIVGTNYIVNANGFFFYNAAKQLIAAIAANSGVDPISDTGYEDVFCVINPVTGDLLFIQGSNIYFAVNGQYASGQIVADEPGVLTLFPGMLSAGDVAGGIQLYSTAAGQGGAPLAGILGFLLLEGQASTPVNFNSSQCVLFSDIDGNCWFWNLAGKAQLGPVIVSLLGTSVTPSLIETDSSNSFGNLGVNGMTLDLNSYYILSTGVSSKNRVSVNIKGHATNTVAAGSKTLPNALVAPYLPAHDVYIQGLGAAGSFSLYIAAATGEATLTYPAQTSGQTFSIQDDYDIR